VLTTVAIGDRRSLTVVRFGERTLLLGSTAQSVTLLASDDDDLPALPEALAPRSVADALRASQDYPADSGLSFAG
jgi:flagellar biogenesis protein FliO